jgi:septum formation protein
MVQRKGEENSLPYLHDSVTNLILASQSARRKELLAILGLPFSVVAAEIDESPHAAEPPEEYVVRIAREKARAVASHTSHSQVLSADTIVTIDGEILGKPVDQADAVRMLSRLSGRRHFVYTAVCLIDQVKDTMAEGIERTDVWFSPLDEAAILDYIRREDVMDKAGAYAIQGFASVYIPRIEGNYSNVMGLPLPLVFRLLGRAASAGSREEEI